MDERLIELEKSLAQIKQTDILEAKPKERKLILIGYCLAKFDQDIIYQVCLNFGRDLIDELEKFIKERKK